MGALQPGECDERTRQEYDQVYKFMLVTHKGYCDIIFRNSSNGNYGGCLKYLQDEPIYDSRYIAAKEPIKWLELKEDYTA